MARDGKPWRLAEAKDQRPPPLRGLTLALKIAGLVVGGTLTMLVTASLLGSFIEAVWLQLVLAAIPTIGLPLLLVDRLLPSDGSSRPGLLSDVAALLWMGVATLGVVLAPASLQGSFDHEATRLDASGMARSAQTLRWFAELDAPVPTAAPEPEPAVDNTELAAADPPEDDKKTEGKGSEFTPAPTEGERKPLPAADLFAQWAPSVVTIKSELAFGNGVGTGFVIASDGTIATNNHVIEDADRLVVKLFSGTEVSQVELLEKNEQDDLALIRIKTEETLTPVVLGVSDDVKVGEPVIVIGNPIGLEHTLTDGLVSARRLYEGKKYIQMSAPVSPGNSGGPVFNAYGDVVGVTVAKLRGENLNLAVPVDLLKPMVKDEYPSAQDVGKSSW